ncbi:MAG: DNA gyrase subunit A [Planctomycetota bacterium]
MSDSSSGPQIRDIRIEEDLKDSYLRYAMSTLISRALPRVEDGLKPSQRRILVAMHDLDLGPRSKHRKCAKIVGDTCGNYHPHGDQAVYATLVRMAQDFSCRYPLVNGQGNFGSVDGDPPAAPRYTEARMDYPTMEMLADIEKDTVDFVPNYEETRTEPTVLPGKFPNLLCNGSSGIAVGMATSIPPHNLCEVVDALIAVIENPEIDLDGVMEHIEGPDFPTGAIVCGRKAIRDAYRTGRGNVAVRARASVESRGKDRKNIVVTEIPYQVTRTNIKEKIARAVDAERIKGVADIRDESDRTGQRLVIQLKRGEDENIVLNQLYKYTPLQSTVSILLVALYQGQPQTLGLLDLLHAYRDHRVDVIRRRTQYLLKKAEARAHILEGLKIALHHIDAVVRLIRNSETVDAAREGLMDEFKLTRTQAQAILDMRLQRLTNLEKQKIQDEYRELIERINEYNLILESERRVLEIIKEELRELKERYGDERRTEIREQVEDLDREDLIVDENVLVTISHEGYIKRMPLARYRTQGRGGIGIIGAKMKEGDFVESLFTASTHDYILFFTTEGKVHWLKVYDVPQLGRTSRGRSIVNLLRVPRSAAITSMIPVREFDDRFLLMATERGIVKKTELSAFGRPQRGGIIAINLDEGDRLIAVRMTSGDDDVMLCTRNGKSARFHESEVRAMGRATRGVKGITLKDDDAVVGLIWIPAGRAKTMALLTACEHGYGKRTAFSEYPTHGRGVQGVVNIKTTERNGKVVAVRGVAENDEIMLMTSGGMMVRTRVSDVSTIGRNTQGVKLITPKAGQTLVAVARLPVESPGEETEQT